MSKYPALPSIANTGAIGWVCYDMNIDITTGTDVNGTGPVNFPLIYTLPAGFVMSLTQCQVVETLVIDNADDWTMTVGFDAYTFNQLLSITVPLTNGVAAGTWINPLQSLARPSKQNFLPSDSQVYIAGRFSTAYANIVAGKFVLRVWGIYPQALPSF